MWSFFSRDTTKDFPYEIGERVSSSTGFESKSIWSLHKGKRKGSGHKNEEVSIFVYDIKNGSDIKLELAKGSMKRLKTLRHPSILIYLDSLETEKVLYIATEPVEPLGAYIENLEKQKEQTSYKEIYLAWGIFQITRALSFLNNDGNLRHNNVSTWSVFVNASLEWKLGGFEFVSPVDTNVLPPIKVPPSLEIYDPPEKNDSSVMKSATKCSSDMWGLGCLVWESFNGALKNPASLKIIEHIPQSLTPVYCELVGAKPSTRPNPADVITKCRKPGGFFKNDLVDTLLFLEEIQIKDKSDKFRFFNTLVTQIDNFPQNVCRKKILPQLITAFNFGEAGSGIIQPLLKIANYLDDKEYQIHIVPCLLKLFSSTDRATRSRLLQNLELFIVHLEPKVVDQIFPQVVNGFLDTHAIIRELTVKSMIHLAPKLNYENLNFEVLRHFARLQSKDDQVSIRTNTTICLGKIAPHLHYQVRQKVLISAFIRAMGDPFAPARIAGILALAATQQYFVLNDVATRVLPALCSLTVDLDKSVRENAFKTIRGFLGKLEKVSEDPTLKVTMEAEVHTATPSTANLAPTWAGWAVSAVRSQFYRSQSDTSRPPPTRQVLSGKSKTRSLEQQPSSSSLSTTTTTSSVTSMTSLEPESNGTPMSASDYTTEWDNDNWGDMDTSQDPSSPMVPDATNSANLSPQIAQSDIRDGWDNDEWGSLEEDPNEEVIIEEEKEEMHEEIQRPTDLPNLITNHNLLRNPINSNSKNIIRPDIINTNNTTTINTTSTIINDTVNEQDNDNLIIDNSKSILSSPITTSSSTPTSRTTTSISNTTTTTTATTTTNWTSDSWTDGEFEPIDGSNTGTKMDETRRKREEKNMQRQRELELRRAARTPLKLGSKKI